MAELLEPPPRPLPGERHQKQQLRHDRDQPDPPTEAPDCPVLVATDQREQQLHRDHDGDRRSGLPARLELFLAQRVGRHRAHNQPRHVKYPSSRESATSVSGPSRTTSQKQTLPPPDPPIPATTLRGALSLKLRSRRQRVPPPKRPRRRIRGGTRPGGKAAARRRRRGQEPPKIRRMPDGASRASAR